MTRKLSEIKGMEKAHRNIFLKSSGVLLPMKKILTGLLAVYFLACSVLALDIVKDGKPCAAIMTAENAGPAQKWAAQQLQEYVMKATGCKLEIITEGRAQAKGALISIGHTKAAKKVGLKTDGLKYDGCKLLVKENILYLLGNDYISPKGTAEGNVPNPQNGEPQGTIRAVTMFLEDVMGVRWYLPGPEGVFIPSVKNLSVPETLDKTFIPQLAFCDTGYDTPIAQYANNGRKSIKILLFGGHTWYTHVPAKEYSKEHPEYFIMDGAGKRHPEKNHLCTSNPDVRKIMLQKLRKSFDKGYDIIEVGQTDGWEPCLCPECQKKYGDGKIPCSAKRPPERIWELYKWLSDELKKSHPDKYLLPISYGPTRFPSKLFDKLPGNMMIEFAGSPENEIWKGKYNFCAVYDPYIWETDCVSSCFLPAMSPEWLQQRMQQLYQKCGVLGLYGGGRGVCWGLGGPSFYAYAKLAGDPDVDIDEMITEYCNTVYGKAGPTMERFFKLFHSRSGKTLLDKPGFKSIHPDENVLSSRDRVRFENGYPVEDTFCALYPPSVVERLERLLKKAENMAKSKRAKGWLKHMRDEFDGLKTIAEMFAAKRAFELHPTKPMLLLVKEKVNAFENWRMRILSYSQDPEYVKKWFPRYIYFCNDLISAGTHGKWDKYYYHPHLVWQEIDAIAKGQKSIRGKGIGSSLGHHEILEPITWNFDQIMMNIGRPKEEKRIIVRRTTVKPDKDGILPPKLWQNVPAVLFEPYKAGSSSLNKNTSTSVRLLYDDKNLFIHYECKENQLEDMKLKALSRDGNVWGLDEVELFLNPECSTRKFMHFMAAPVKTAMYDERKGYIEDTLDPRYSAADIAWNADWTYAYTIDKKNKLWTLDMTIPFGSLGVKMPHEGIVWNGNFARCRRAGKFEELSCWIPEDLNSPELFGELIFGDKGGEVSGRSQDISSHVSKQTPEKDILKNASFEQVGNGEKALNWSISAFPQANFKPLLACCSVTSEKAHSGKRSLKIDFQNVNVNAASKAFEIVFSQKITIEALKLLRGKKVKLSLWLNYDYIDEDKAAINFPGPYFVIRAWGKSGQLLRVSEKKTPLIFPKHNNLFQYGIVGEQSTGKWIRLEQDGWIPEETENLDIHCGLCAWDNRLKKANITSVYIDDISLEALDEARSGNTAERLKAAVSERSE